MVDTGTLSGLARSILTSPECRAIDFVVDNVHVDGAGLQYVALSLIAPRRGRPGMGVAIRGLRAGVGGMYEADDDRLVFARADFGRTPHERRAIVHECTHALVDARRQNTAWVTNEVCAYVAGEVYNQQGPNPAPPSKTIFGAAVPVARKVLAGQRSGPVALTENDVAELRIAVLVHPVYAPTLRSMGAAGIDEASGLPLSRRG